MAYEQHGLDINLRKSIFRGLLKLSLVVDVFKSIFCFVGGGWSSVGSYHRLLKSPLSPWSPLNHGVACLHWPLLSLSDMILKFQYLHISSDTYGFLLYKVDLQMVVLTEGNHIHVVSSRMIARMITSVPFKLDIFLPV